MAISRSYLESIGQSIKTEARGWRHRYMKFISEDAKNFPSILDYYHDIAVCQQLMTLDAYHMGLVAHNCMPHKLIAMGYDYTYRNKNTGDTIVPIMTAVLGRVRDKFGKQAVWSAGTDNTKTAMRGILVDDEVIQYFLAETDKLLVKLLATEPEELQEVA